MALLATVAFVAQEDVAAVLPPTRFRTGSGPPFRAPKRRLLYQNPPHPMGAADRPPTCERPIAFDLRKRLQSYDATRTHCWKILASNSAAGTGGEIR